MVVLENVKGIGCVMNEVVGELRQAGPYAIAVTPINPPQSCKHSV